MQTITARYPTLEDKIKKSDPSFYSRRKEHDALCHWREYIKNKKQGEGQAVVCIEEEGRGAPNQEEKTSLIKDIQTYAIVCKHLKVF